MVVTLPLYHFALYFISSNQKWESVLMGKTSVAQDCAGLLGLTLAIPSEGDLEHVCGQVRALVNICEQQSSTAQMIG